jgi:hypothetical protein
MATQMLEDQTTMWYHKMMSVRAVQRLFRRDLSWNHAPDTVVEAVGSKPKHQPMLVQKRQLTCGFFCRNIFRDAAS